MPFDQYGCAHCKARASDAGAGGGDVDSPVAAAEKLAAAAGDVHCVRVYVIQTSVCRVTSMCVFHHLLKC